MCGDIRQFILRRDLFNSTCNKVAPGMSGNKTTFQISIINSILFELIFLLIEYDCELSALILPSYY